MKKGTWKDVVNITNTDSDGGMKQTWLGIKRILGKQAGEADTGIAALRAQDGSSSALPQRPQPTER